MDLTTALEASYAEGMGCCLASAAEEDGIAYLRRVRTVEGFDFEVCVVYPPSRRSMRSPSVRREPSLPARLSVLKGRWRLCPLPAGVEPDLRPDRSLKSVFRDQLD